MKYYIVISLMILSSCVFATQAAAQTEDTRSEKKLFGSIGVGREAVFAFRLDDDVPEEDFITSGEGIPVKGRLGVLTGSQSLYFLSARKTFFLQDPIENVPDFAIAVGSLFPHNESSNLYHLIEVGVMQTRDSGTFFELTAGEAFFFFLGFELIARIGVGNKESSPITVAFEFSLHLHAPLLTFD